MTQPYTSDRIIFEKNKQSKFILDCKFDLRITWTALAEILKINCRTLHDWSKEKKKMSYDSAVFLSEKTGILLPRKIKIIKWSDHLKRISIKGGKAHYKRYGRIGNEMTRQKAWQIWWNEKGKYRNFKILQRRGIRIPIKDIFLAEFVGIVIGDGNISDYAVRITLDSLADKEYISYVSSLIKRLFNVNPKIFKHKKYRAVDIVVHRKNLVEYCVKLGLNIGDKIRQNLDIPNWIKENKNFSIACVRGLVDTDGCFFNHSYKSNGKNYHYTKIAFTNRNKILIESVKKILMNLGFHVRITKDGNDIRIENQEDVLRYMDIVGTSNPKFMNKIIQGNVSELV